MQELTPAAQEPTRSPSTRSPSTRSPSTRSPFEQPTAREPEPRAAFEKLIPAVVWMVALVGVAGGAVALHGRGSEDLFRLRQSYALGVDHASTPSAARVEAVVAQAPEPVAAPRRTPPAAVRCGAHAGGTLGNPWSCTIRYRSGTHAHYRVVVQPNGEYTGVGTGIIDGCCVKVSTLE